MKLVSVRRTRELKGMTQPELAEAASVSLKTIVNVEGQHSVRPTTARKLADALDVSVAVLAGVEPFPVAQAGAEAKALQLEEMYVATAAERSVALGAARDEERERYVGAIDRVIFDVVHTMPEWEEIAADTTKPEHERRVAREAAESLYRHIRHLFRLRDEATGEVGAPGALDEMEGLVAHARVA